MSSTPTAGLRLELQATGENDATWGTKNNTNLQLLENAIMKRQAVALTNVDVTLSTANYADDQSRCLCLSLSGVLTGNVNIIVPAVSHFYLVENACTGAFTVTIKTATGTGIASGQGVTSAVYCNGTNVVQVQAAASDATTLDGLDSTAFARLASANQFTRGTGHTFLTVADGGTLTGDCSQADRFITTLGGNRTVDLTSPSDGQTIEWWFIQDATGGRTVTWPATVVWEGGAAPVFSTAANSLDRVQLTYNTARTTWIGRAGTSVSGGSTIAYELGANEDNVRLYQRVGSPGSAVVVNLTVPLGVVIASKTAALAALDLRGFPGGSTINVTNLGLVHGRGGDGGKGAGGAVQATFDDAQFSSPGKAGGDAIIGPGAGVTFNLTNGSGRVWGGGGGGGGGGCTVSSGGTDVANGGGGGGGAGGGNGMLGGASTLASGTSADYTGFPGGDGTPGYVGAAGAGGAGNEIASASADGASGGNGGAYGVAGSAGSGTTGGAFDFPAGSGGAAGKAINLNGGAVTIISGSGSPNIEGAVS